MHQHQQPGVLLAAGLLAKKAVEAGLKVKPHIKTSLAPGSRIVTEYLEKTGLLPYLEKLGFAVAAYGCTTCIGNAGDLSPEINETITKNDLVCAAVLSGNRNFEARIHPNLKANFLASPPLVVAYAIAGSVLVDVMTEPLGKGKERQGRLDRRHLADVGRGARADAFRAWTRRRSSRTTARSSPIRASCGRKSAASRGRSTRGPSRPTSPKPPFFDGFKMKPTAADDGVRAARALGIFGDSITTDHISPAGSIKDTSPAGRWLHRARCRKADFNSYGSRRGNHEVMMRGTFANVRIKNLMVPPKADGSRIEGGITVHQPDRRADADLRRRHALHEGRRSHRRVRRRGVRHRSSRDWAAKGTQLLGVKAVIAKSFERIHRSNLVGMGVLPLQFMPGEGIETFGIRGDEMFDIEIEGAAAPQMNLTLLVFGKDGEKQIPVKLRIDTPIEVEYYKHGGILPYVLRQLLAA